MVSYNKVIVKAIDGDLTWVLDGDDKLFLFYLLVCWKLC
jgi:hypothetical protein